MDTTHGRNKETEQPTGEDITENIRYWVKQKEDLKQVPMENVFETAEELEEEA